MSWYANLSFSVVVVLLMVIIFFYVNAIRHDIKVVRKYNSSKKIRNAEKDAVYNNTLNGNKDSLTQVQRAEVRDIYNEMKNESVMYTSDLTNGAVDGALIGLLSWAIVGGLDLAISNAFIWVVIKTLTIGIQQMS